MRSVAFGFVAVALTACGLDMVGTAPSSGADAGLADGSGVSRNAGEGGVAGGSDAGLGGRLDGGGSGVDGGKMDAGGGGDASRGDAAVCSPSGCALAPIAGWTLVAYAGSRAASCPAGFVTDDLLEEPRAAAGACTCGACDVQSAPGCSDGVLLVTYDDDSPDFPCGRPGVPILGGGGKCQVFDGHAGAHTFVASPLPSSSGGACVAAGVPHPAVTTQSVRACAPAACASACDPSLGAPFATCMRAPGDVACPPSAPHKHTVGTRVAVACGSCPCSVSATCSGTLTLYADEGCADEQLSFPADRCYLTDHTRLHSYRWNGVATPTCSVGAPPAGTATFEDPSTICCP